ncbi:permease of the drug/metabolite transporter superfamily [Sporolactobacillus inulinus]|uniref:Permease of the drug/metabolite transporter superfamily n=1 Tax=Sporolactobacillus inulinus TaxID=2078 RepID=A0A4Y1ZF89_9BACL|nr:permease of the drug/metabolite transporter superfamily [Sporolactobacillus inulinus]
MLHPACFRAALFRFFSFAAHSWACPLPFMAYKRLFFKKKLKAEYLGRVFSLFGSLASLAMPVGLLFSGLFAEQLGVHRWFFISGLAVIGIAVMAFRLPSIHQLN